MTERTNEAAVTTCLVDVWDGWHSHICGRPVKRNGKCGLHAAADERRARNDAALLDHHIKVTREAEATRLDHSRPDCQCVWCRSERIAYCAVSGPGHTENHHIPQCPGSDEGVLSDSPHGSDCGPDCPGGTRLMPYEQVRDELLNGPGDDQ